MTPGRRPIKAIGSGLSSHTRFRTPRCTAERLAACSMGSVLGVQLDMGFVLSCHLLRDEAFLVEDHLPLEHEVCGPAELVRQDRQGFASAVLAKEPLVELHPLGRVSRIK